MPVGVGLVIPLIIIAVIVKVVGPRLLRPWPRASEAADRYALWAPFPLMFVALLFLFWPLAIAWAVAALVIVAVGPRRLAETGVIPWLPRRRP
jgi:hypothetical protein